MWWVSMVMAQVFPSLDGAKRIRRGAGPLASAHGPAPQRLAARRLLRGLAARRRGHGLCDRLVATEPEALAVVADLDRLAGAQRVAGLVRLHLDPDASAAALPAAGEPGA